MLFSMTVEILDLRDIFPFFLDDVGVSTHCKRVMAITPSISLTSKTSLVVLFLFASLALVDRRLLVLATKYISGKSVSGLNLSKVFLFFFCEPVSLRTF